MHYAVEIVTNASDAAATARRVAVAVAAGAQRVEVCAAMEVEGLTPGMDCVAAARAQAPKGQLGVMVMVRPRDGEFCYTQKELDVMCAQIENAAANGADGVVIGALTPGHVAIDVPASKRLLRIAADNGVAVTYHRAVDAMPDVGNVTAVLIDLGVQRVLTSGVAWGKKGTALDGLARLQAMAFAARGRIELVLAGGISAALAPQVLAQLPRDGRYSLHAYSSIILNSEPDAGRIAALVSC